MLYIQIHQQKNLDIFSFFPVKNALKCPDDMWFEAITSSLKMKHSVLILEAPLSPIPECDGAKRFVASDNWCWLAPRALSLIAEAYHQNPMTFQQFKIFLKNSK